MFSGRIAWPLEPNEYSKLLDRKRRAGAAILDLTESNPTRAGFVYPDGILQALANPAGLLYEPTPVGLPAARQAVADHHRVPPDRVVLTASTSESYSYLFKLLCDPGDHVLVPQPSYPLFEFLARLESVELDPYPLVYEDGWRIGVEALRSRVTPRTRAVLLVNPNNPTGSYVRPNEVAALAALGLPVVSDEVFHAYPLDGEEPATDWTPVEERTLLVRLYGLSKSAGLPQMKAGWMLLGGPDALRRAAAERLEWIADTFLSVASPVQHALPELLRLGEAVRLQILDRARANLHWLRQQCEPLRADAGWYAILPLPEGTNEYGCVLRLLDEDDVLVQPGFFYDFAEEGRIVLSLLPPPETFRDGIERLLHRLRCGAAA